MRPCGAWEMPCDLWVSKWWHRSASTAMSPNNVASDCWYHHRAPTRTLPILRVDAAHTLCSRGRIRLGARTFRCAAMPQNPAARRFVSAMVVSRCSRTGFSPASAFPLTFLFILLTLCCLSLSLFFSCYTVLTATLSLPLHCHYRHTVATVCLSLPITLLPLFFDSCISCGSPLSVCLVADSSGLLLEREGADESRVNSLGLRGVI